MEEEGFATHKTAGAALDLLYHTWQIFRGVYEMEIIEHGVGFRPALLDNQPLYDKTSFENAFICTGQYRHGVFNRSRRSTVNAKYFGWNDQSIPISKI